jgi:hypothetical protein
MNGCEAAGIVITGIVALVIVMGGSPGHVLVVRLALNRPARLKVYQTRSSQPAALTGYFSHQVRLQVRERSPKRKGWRFGAPLLASLSCKP